MKRFPRFIETAWAVWETFRRLGYSPEELWVGTRPTLLANGLPAEGFFVLLRKKGSDDEDDWFKVAVGVVDAGSTKDNSALWLEWAELLNADRIPKHKLLRIYRREIPDVGTVATIVANLKARGFPVPKLDS